MDKAEAAARLGVPETEVAGVRDAVDGPVATTTDGREYLLGEVVAFYGDAPKETAFPVVQPSAATEEPASDVDGDGVPDGSAKQVLEWVGNDPDRAALALGAERNKGDDARSTLIRDLEKLVG